MKKLTSLVIILAVISLLTTTAFADPIHEAAIAGNLADLKRALGASADTNAKDENGATALHHAAGNGHKEAAELLIAKGADMAAKDNRSGSTPLHWAAYRGREKVVEVLIAKGAEVNAKAENGNTPLDLAVNNEEVATLLRKHGGKLGSIHAAARAGNDEAVKEFLAAGADVNAKNNNGLTPLDVATRGKSTKTVEFLRKKGGRSGSEDSILVAAIMGNIEAVKQHLTGGADVELKCKSCGGTALSHTESKEVVKLLIDKGADVNSKIEAGQYTGTPLDWAESVSRRDSPEVKASKKGIADLLRKHGAKEGN